MRPSFRLRRAVLRPKADHGDHHLHPPPASNPHKQPSDQSFPTFSMRTGNLPRNGQVGGRVSSSGSTAQPVHAVQLLLYRLPSSASSRSLAWWWLDPTGGTQREWGGGREAERPCAGVAGSISSSAGGGVYLWVRHAGTAVDSSTEPYCTTAGHLCHPQVLTDRHRGT